jgi:hypothetical protein
VNIEQAKNIAKARWGAPAFVRDNGRAAGDQRFVFGVRYTLFGRHLSSFAFGVGPTLETALADCKKRGVEPQSIAR